ncbi:MAG: ribonuclease P protein component, partial [Candidatus Margulisiibacteriota bacterium]
DAIGLRSPKSLTIKKDRDFGSVLRKGIRISGRIAAARVCFRAKGPSRIGIAVKKTICCAAKRNRIRRIFKEAFREEYSNIKRPADAVIFPNSGAVSAE